MNYETKQKKTVRTFKASVQRRLGTLHSFFLYINFIIMFFYLSIFFCSLCRPENTCAERKGKRNKKRQNEAHIGRTEISFRLLSAMS